ncbi:hypothetical protein THRCLA_08145, partial [Thraustotheca clavata]
ENELLNKHIKPGIYFYKFLQPLGNKQLKLNLPDTVIVEPSNTMREELLWLGTNENGIVVCLDRPINWKRKYIADMMMIREQPAQVDLSHAHFVPKAPQEKVVAVRKMYHSKPHEIPSTLTIAIPMQYLERILNSDTKKMGAVYQKYVRCRGANAAYYRAVWIEGSQHPYALYTLNKAKYLEYSKQNVQDRDIDLYDDALDACEEIAKYYCASATSIHPSESASGLSYEPDLNTSKLRGFIHQCWIPSIHFDAMEVDFIKDIDGKWWFLQVKSFHYVLRGNFIPEINDENDSLVSIPKQLTQRYKLPTKNSKPCVTLHSSMLCFLCHSTFQLSVHDLEALGLVMDEDDGMKMATNSSGYIMSFKMIVDTISALRQRGIYMTVWEASLALQRGLSQQLVLSNECRVCFICYQIYKHQLRVTATAKAIHDFFHADPEHPPQPIVRIDSIVQHIKEYRREHYPHDFSFSEQILNKVRLHAVRGHEVDPSSNHFCICIFFHELQDVTLREAQATDYLLEYQLGQAFCKLSFEGPKFHSIHRWQLCETRMHYVLATADAFIEYCNEAKIEIKLKSKSGEFEGHTFLSLKPLLLAAQMVMKSDEEQDEVNHNTRQRFVFPKNCSCDVLLHVRTNVLGLLKLKITLGLIACQDEFSNYRGAIENMHFIQESNAYWPQLSYFKPSVVLPIEWMTLLTSSEFVTHASTVQNAGVLRNDAAIEKVALGTLALPPIPEPKKEENTTENIRNYDRALAPPIVTVRNLVFRIAGPVDTFPALLLGHLLRAVNYGKLSYSHPSVWRENATLELCTNYTIDTIFLGLVKDKPSRLEPLAVFAELLLLLLSMKRIPRMLSLKALEATFTPYWLQRTSNIMEPLNSTMDNENSVLLSKRIIWNRAIRRCQLVGFGNPKHSFLARMEWPGHIPATQILHCKRSLRTRQRLLAYVQMFELVECNDSGYIDIGEFRCLPQSIGSGARLLRKRHTTFTDRSFIDPSELMISSPSERRISIEISDEELSNSSKPQASMHLLQAWDDRLFNHVITSFESILSICVHSKQFQAAFTHFDQYGSGGFAFQDFWSMAENALLDKCDLKPVQGFCLRHGLTEFHASDYICILCDLDYVDPFFLEIMLPLKSRGDIVNDTIYDEDLTSMIRMQSTRFNPSDFPSQIILEANSSDDEPEVDQSIDKNSKRESIMPLFNPSDDDDSSQGSEVLYQVNEKDEDEEDSRDLSYFKQVESNFITKAFEDKVESRIQQRYTNIQSISQLDFVTKDEAALSDVLGMLQAAEKEIDIKNTTPKPKCKLRLRKSASVPIHNVSEKQVEVDQPKQYHKLNAQTQLRMINRLYKKTLKQQTSYTSLLQKELKTQPRFVRGKADLLRSVERIEALRQETDAKIADEIQSLQQQLHSLHRKKQKRGINLKAQLPVGVERR